MQIYCLDLPPIYTILANASSISGVSISHGSWINTVNMYSRYYAMWCDYACRLGSINKAVTARCFDPWCWWVIRTKGAPRSTYWPQPVLSFTPQSELNNVKHSGTQSSHNKLLSHGVVIPFVTRSWTSQRRGLTRECDQVLETLDAGCCCCYMVQNVSLIYSVIIMALPALNVLLNSLTRVAWVRALCLLWRNMTVTDQNVAKWVLKRSDNSSFYASDATWLRGFAILRIVVVLSRSLKVRRAITAKRATSTARNNNGAIKLEEKPFQTN